MGSRSELMSHVAELLPDVNGRVLVGVDGVDGSGKSIFADELADAVSRTRAVVRISLDDFHNARAVRYGRGRSSPVGYWLDAFDYELFRRWVLVPMSPGGSGIYRRRSRDLLTDRLVVPEPEEAPANCVVIIDGVFLHRDELADVWHFSVFLRVPFEESIRRMAQRDGSPSDPAHAALRRYVNAQRLYFAECSPERRASIVIDNTNLSHPFDVAP